MHWSYCVNQTSNYDSQTILYHFHGRNGAATWWNDDTYYSAEIQRHWRQTGVTPPLVVSISFGKLWLLVDWEAANAPNLYHIFLDTAMQTVEQRLGMPIKERMLVGESMGGFNALLIGLKDKSRFLKVAALCPPLPTVSPFASWHDKISYVTASSTSWKRATTLLFFAHIFFPDKQT
ncbi:MAG: alpha/beta hydrolase-fold protein, partial [Proteobacteria bacterium]|nr:alpha/beta hydrolase-fold protein [Pseudomonadota bacterium]